MKLLAAGAAKPIPTSSISYRGINFARLDHAGFGSTVVWWTWTANSLPLKRCNTPL